MLFVYKMGQTYISYNSSGQHPNLHTIYNIVCKLIDQYISNHSMLKIVSKGAGLAYFFCFFLFFFRFFEVLANYYHYCSFFWLGAKLSEIVFIKQEEKNNHMTSTGILKCTSNAFPSMDALLSYGRGVFIFINDHLNMKDMSRLYFYYKHAYLQNVFKKQVLYQM